MVGKIFLKLDPMGGILNPDGILSEKGEIYAVGDGIENFAVGERVAVKLWGCDHIELEGEDYYVVDVDSKALLCKIL